MATANFHEDLGREDIVKGPSNRKFGVTFSVIFAVLAVLLAHRHISWAYAAGTMAVLSLILGLRFPDVLTAPNRAWLKLGLLLNKIVSPIVMIVLFFVVIMPIGLIIRLFRKDLLRLKRDRSAQTYWLSRSDSRNATESMRQQF